MKFKVGDKVRTNYCSQYRDPEREHTVTEIKGSNIHYKGGFDIARSLELVSRKRGRPRKGKTVKFVVIYDEQDRDPVKEFTTKKALMTWLEEARENEDIIWDSIKVIPVSKIYKPEAKTKVKLV